MYLRTPRVLSLSILALGMALAGCQRENRPDLAPEVRRLTEELQVTKDKLALTEKNLAAKTDQLAVAPVAVDNAKAVAAEKDKVIAQKDNEIRNLHTEIANLKKSDAFIFAEIRAVQAQGLVSTALGRYQQFVLDFPTSPLVANAKSAIGELTVDVTRRADQMDPKRREREAVQHFNEGVLTIEEIVPVIKNKSVAEVVKMLGNPNKTFRNGAELGYASRVINPATGEKGMLIIRFEENNVATVRVDYAGREIKP